MNPYFFLDYIKTFLLSPLNFFLIAGIVFFIFYKLFSNKLEKSKIQNRKVSKQDLRREILHSIQTTLIIIFFVTIFTSTSLKKYTLFYDNIHEFPLWWIPTCILISLIIYDTYFYWIHRIIHSPVLFKKVHIIHHKSIAPNPWTSRSYNFIDGVLESLIVPIILMIIPTNAMILIGFALSSLIINVYGHLGYEIMPKWFRYSWLFQIINTSVYHNLHHSNFRGNYGLYFRFWDRLMKTENPNYVKEYDKIQEKRFGKQ